MDENIERKEKGRQLGRKRKGWYDEKERAFVKRMESDRGKTIQTYKEV
jgi:hypothetical protein